MRWLFIPALGMALAGCAAQAPRDAFAPENSCTKVARQRQDDARYSVNVTEAGADIYRRAYDTCVAYHLRYDV